MNIQVEQGVTGQNYGDNEVAYNSKHWNGWRILIFSVNIPGALEEHVCLSAAAPADLGATMGTSLMNFGPPEEFYDC